MALTSEDVVEHGGQVVEQVNKLSEAMIVFQQRLGELSSGFAEMSQHVDQRESDVLVSLGRLEEATQNAWHEEISEMHETLWDVTREPASSTMDDLPSKIISANIPVARSNEQVIEGLQDWRLNQVSSLMNQLDEAKGTNITSVESLTGTAGEDLEQINTTAQAYVDKVSDNSDLLGNFIDDEILSPIADVTETYSSTIEEFSSTMEGMMTTAGETMFFNQSFTTVAMMDEVVELFSSTIKEELMPLIDEMVDEVSASIDDMLEKVINIGDEAEDKSKALDGVTDMLENLLHPIKDSISRVQGIHDTVSAFV